LVLLASVVTRELLLSLSRVALPTPSPLFPYTTLFRSVREAARLQSFPDRYEFSGSLGSRQKQVGNAVPPLLARAVGIAIRTHLRSEEHTSELQSPDHLVCRLLLEKKKKTTTRDHKKRA